VDINLKSINYFPKVFACTTLLLLSSISFAAESIIQKTDEILQQYSEIGAFSGNITLFENGNVIYEKSTGLANVADGTKNTPNTKIRIGSINKHYTATLILQMAQSGQLSLDDTLAKFELGFANAIASRITVRHLLQHKSGFADLFTEEYIRTYRDLKDINDKLPLLLDSQLIAEPGTKFSYSNYGYIVLGAILEKLENRPFQNILENNILKVIGANNTDYKLTELVKNKARSYHVAADGSKTEKTDILENVTPDGGMYATASDIGLFYSKLLYSNELLNDKYKAIMATGYKNSDKTWEEILNSDAAHWTSYGGAPGVSAAVEVAIKDKLIVVVLANTGNQVAERMSQKIIAARKTL
jgi:CubicO group peptidase (beta-lactamase class C family)